MERNLEIKEIMKLLHPLSTKSKLEIISNLSNELRADISIEDKEINKLLYELFGSWKDSDENLIDEIINNRSVSDKKINIE